MKEMWDLYTQYREKTGETIERGEDFPEGYFHLAVSIWIKNSSGEYLLSQRHPNKQYPLKWECTGGSVISGETSLQGAIREVKEELGINLNAQKGTLVYRKRRNQQNDFYDVWMFNIDFPLKNIRLQSSEVIEVKWVKKEEILYMYEENQLHPLLDNLESIL